MVYVEIEKRKFHSSKNAIPVDVVYIDSIVISEDFPCIKNSFKYLIGYKNTDEFIPWESCSQKWVGIEEEKLLKAYYEVWGQIKKKKRQNTC